MEDNYCVIMGGGIGSRFWPFSKKSCPKQFLDFFCEGRSLLQMTFDRFAKIIPVENIYIVTNELYADLVKEQLPELDSAQILLEPSSRNTAPCVAYAAYHIRAVNPNANIVVAPSDHLIRKEEEFLRDVQKGLDFVRVHKALVTLGIKPSRPETGYGYIQSSESMMGEFVKVKTFTEKPNLELAKVFQESGEFFWNSGLFLWNVNTVLAAFAKHLPDISARFDLGIGKYNTKKEAAFIKEHFPYCSSISIDYGIMEKADNVYMLCVDFGWADLGTWGSLYDLSEHKDGQGNAFLKKNKALLYESSGNLISLENAGRLVVLQGMEDYIIAESENVLLICKKNDEQRIKQFVADAKLKYGEQFN
ncbi:Mannose-1-phosphate guanylyltransferase rfbM [Bacteroidales bacterium Barb7]|nr:Mannose-1-phosphate guanylyltransferase rfbM [Bacteroidales bacterium Barb4]OAV67639.1 Mannose-1-phosphate guanylyltransferase rfbM [Bacteroidales bacterium Barb6XT]OAV74094.1 Mannose-1-phosphate guanylyltransferase rfbM [Bacteroidales bacterium Barb7]OAV75585.1 Mannose-1-phosphate guanylyltransferase rfbM [Bacteroidales bacterium Barb7]